MIVCSFFLHILSNFDNLNWTSLSFANLFSDLKMHSFMLSYRRSSFAKDSCPMLGHCGGIDTSKGDVVHSSHNKESIHVV